jgi:hypothetical protein
MGIGIQNAAMMGLVGHGVGVGARTKGEIRGGKLGMRKNKLGMKNEE